MNYLGLTKINDEKVAINLKYVIAFLEKKESNGTRIYLRDNDFIDVIESFDYIIDTLNKYGVDC